MTTPSATPPDEDRLKALIAEAHEGSPAPDPWRLKTLEERLSRQLKGPKRAKRPSAWVWWVAGALVAGSAAAWWIYESTRDGVEVAPSAPAVEQTVPLSQPPVPEREGSEPRGSAETVPPDPQTDRAPAQRKRPTIFRREAY